MSFDWPRFLDGHRIEYVTSGPSVVKGNIAIQCPWCGSEDHSTHLSINLEGKGYRCWRNPEHRGKSPVRLIQTLLHCSYDKAREIAGHDVFIPTDFLSRVQQQIAPPPTKPKPKLVMPKSFKPFGDLPSAQIFLDYMRHRGFADRDLMTMTKRYGLHYCTMGPFKGRIIFPCFFEGRLVTWTGRTVYRQEQLRYKTLSADAETAESEGVGLAINPITHYLLWYDDLIKAEADTILLCEGPMDSLKVNVLGRKYGITSTCFFTAAPSVQQINLCHELLPQFKHRYILLDNGTLPTAIRTQAGMTRLGLKVLQMPRGLKDPGELRVSSQLLALMGSNN